MNRRLFLGAAGLGSLSMLAPPAARAIRCQQRKKLLVLGGTNFLGPAIVEQALAAGHEVTLLNRGITRPHLFPDIEKLRGDRRDRRHGLAALGKAQTWDAVIDVWPADESLVESAARLLEARVEQYLFVSSIAVYRSFSTPWLGESADLRLDDDGYGGAKARSEKLLTSIYTDRCSIARCPAIFGQRDPGSTLHYWLRNLASNVQVLAPGTGDDPAQFVDVRDVAGWLLNSIQSGTNGIYNTAAPPLPFAEFVRICKSVTESTAEITWVSKDFLYNQEVEAFSQIPLWVPVNEDPGFFQISSKKARDAGFNTRPATDTIATAWRWYQSAHFDGTLFPHNGWGISNARQDELLARWQSLHDD